LRRRIRNEVCEGLDANDEDRPLKIDMEILIGSGRR
jgi:hypothetical protein